MSPRPALAVALATVLTLGAAPGVASAAGGVACGDTITGAVRLTANLHCPDGNGIVLADGATLDLGGRVLSGPGASSDAVAITVDHGTAETPAAVTIRNGTVRGWGTAVKPPWYGDPLVATVDAVTFDRNDVALNAQFGPRYDVRRSRFTNNDQAILGFEWFWVTVTDSSFTGNASGFSGSSGLMRIERTAFVRNTVAVDCSEAALELVASTFTRNTTGVAKWWCEGATATRSIFTNNDVAWESRSMVGSEASDRITENVFLNNRVAMNSGESATLVRNTFKKNGVGFRSDAAGADALFSESFTLTENVFIKNVDGIVIPRAEATLTRNVAVRNTGYGIDVPHATDGGGNVAYRNGIEPQCTGVVCAGR